SNLAHDRAVWTDDGASFCPDCAALPAPDDRLKPVEGLRDNGEPLVRLSDALSVIQCKAKQIERLTEDRNSLQSALEGVRTNRDGLLEAAEQQVQKLTAENERLREAFKRLGKSDRQMVKDRSALETEVEK